MLMVIISTFIMSVAGAIFGSFSGAQVWRLRAHQLIEDKAAGEEIDVHEYARLKPLLVKASRDRSRCLNCSQTLAWYDLVPVFSWLSTGGKCRYCHSRIGIFEIAMELGYIAFFVLSYIVSLPELNTWLGMARFAVWLCAGVLMGILLAYDTKWFLLPEKINIALIIFGVVYAGLTYMMTGFDTNRLLTLAGSLLIMSGLYLCIFIVSRGAWIGFGDVILGIGLGLLLLKWEWAFMSLFLANFLGLLAVLPAYIKKQVTGKTHIPFGPFLIVATVLVVLYGQHIMSFGTGVLNAIAGVVLNMFLL